MESWLYTAIGVAVVLLLIRLFVKSVKLILGLAAVGVILVIAVRVLGG